MQHALVFLNLEKIASKQQGIWITIQIAESLDSLSSKANRSIQNLASKRTVFYTKTPIVSTTTLNLGTDRTYLPKLALLLKSEFLTSNDLPSPFLSFPFCSTTSIIHVLTKFIPSFMHHFYVLHAKLYTIISI